jgi:hypothetical protein
MSDESKPVKITFTGKVNYTDQITLSQAANIMAFIDSAAAAPGVAVAGFAQTQAGLGSQRSGGSGATTTNPREALEASGAKTNPERIVAFALYVAQEDDKTLFTLEDVRPLFRRAREPIPANISRDLDNAIKAGWVAATETTGEFFVTERAANVMQTGFDSIRRGRSTGTRTRATAPKKARRTNASKIPAAFESLDDVIEATIDGLIDYHKVSTKGDKVLWAIHAAKTLGVVALDNPETSWLTDRLGDGISAKDVSAYFVRLKQKGYVNRRGQDNKMRITPGGEAHLKSLKVGAPE